MNPLRQVTAVKNGAVKLECGHAIVYAHDGELPTVGAEKYCVQCGHFKNPKTKEKLS
jgi:hypothetical protein